MGKSKSSSHHPSDSHASESHVSDSHAGGGHAAPVETAEQRADRERGERVELAWSRALRKPGALLALFSGSLSIAWLAALAPSAPAMSWTWLLVHLLVFSWALALARGGEPEPVEERAPPASH